MRFQKPEVLAPAGDCERLEAALLFGADAVYLGGEAFGMRASPENFSAEGLAQAVTLCHEKGVKVYLTCNTLPRNNEIDKLPAFIESAARAGVDALIVADLGALRAAKDTAPNLDIHISTQAGVVNWLAARELHAMGATRVILARELSLDEIRVIREKTPPELEIEVFVHGAMCVSFSGRCLLSHYMTGRDANRGQCAQPCRWKYTLTEEKRPGQHFPVFEDEPGTYIMNAQDLCMIEHLDKLADAGVTSFKIEGRAKSAYYVASVTHAYRIAVDCLAQNPYYYRPPEWLLDETRKVSHRDYCTGFFFGEPGQYYREHAHGGYIRDWEVVATVTGYENGKLVCVGRNRFSEGEPLEVLAPGIKPEILVPLGMTGRDGNPLEVSRHPMAEIRIPCNKEYPAGSMLRRKVSNPQ